GSPNTLTSATSGCENRLLDMNTVMLTLRKKMMERRIIIYQDALDTFYKTESFFMNCMSGWDGMINRYNSNHLEVSQAINKQAGNFMIDRFRPTVKAMICKTQVVSLAEKREIHT
ncbi:hypothetical protein L195_g051885, partial [Trifolium pratense]